jgi:hypothetical protein
MTDHGKHTGVALEKAYQFVLWLWRPAPRG